MTATKRICAYYSAGPHFRRMLERLRHDYPNDVLSAWAPPGMSLSESDRSMVDEIVVTELPHFSPANPRACARLIRQLRAMRFDVFAVMFDSPQLGALAALSGATECVWITPRGHCAAIPASLARVGAAWLARNLRGRLVYAWIWIAVRLFKTRA